MTTRFHARPMARHDLPAIATILDRTGLFPPDMLEELATPFLEGGSADLWLVVADEEPRGFVYCVPERLTDNTFNLLAMAVDPDWHRKGLGTRLLRATADSLAKSGGRLLLVETSSLPEYEGTREFYARFGFDQEARIRDFYKAGEDKIVFRRELQVPG